MLLGLAGRLARAQSPPSGPNRVVHLSVLLSAYNESAVIAARLANLRAMAAGLPGSMGCHILVGVDGATDNTAAIVRDAAKSDPDLLLHDFPERRGKVTVLKDLVAAARRLDPEARGDRLLVFTDANTFFAPAAVNRLVAPFAEAAVGGVCGRLRFTRAPGSGSPSPESAYWQWETWLKRTESALDSCLGANGAIYAIREELFWDAIPGNTVVDDFVIGMKVREQGFRVLYEPGAVAEEEYPDLKSEWTRRVRIGSGDFQALGLCRACLSPRFGRFAWMFWSHKVLRWLTPHLALLAVLTAGLATLTLPHDITLWWLALGTAAGFGSLLFAAGIGRLACHSSAWPARWFQLCDHLITMQTALFVGFLRWIRGDLAGHWTRTPRQQAQLPAQSGAASSPPC